MIPYDVDSARHVIKRISNPRFLNYTASYDAASAIHQSLPLGVDVKGRRNSNPLVSPR